MSEEKSVSATPTSLPVSGDIGRLQAEPDLAEPPLSAVASTRSRTGESEYLANFLAETHSYVTQYIQGADQKAIFLFSAAAALLAFLHQDGASDRWLKSPNAWGLVDLISFVAMVALALAAITAVSVVAPRLPSAKKDLVSFLGIAAYDTEAEYAGDLALTPGPALMAKKASHCHTLARVCKAKYGLLRLAVIFEAVGVGGAALYLLVARAGGAV